MKKSIFASAKERLQKIPFSKIWKGMPRLVRWIIYILLAWFILRLFNIVPSFGKIFSRQPVVIDQTPILIKEIKPLAELTTITFFDEVVVDSMKINNEIESQRRFIKLLNPLMPVDIPRLVLIGKGRVMAGLNLKLMDEKKTFILKDSVSMELPKAEILDVIINPADFEVFDETGSWSDAELRALKEKARHILRCRALERNILKKAEDKGRMVMENFLRQTGYKKIHITIAP